MRTLHLSGVLLLAVSALAMSSLVAEQSVPLAHFDSVHLTNGGRVKLRHGPTQKVSLLKGSLNRTSVTIADGNRLLIDKCKKGCPRGYELEVEIVSPQFGTISVSEGGIIESSGSFPLQAEVAVAVDQGGTIDIRSMSVDRVSASVEQGGRIFVRPQTSMVASVSNGGNITYWGEADVKQSIKSGGVIVKGEPADVDKPLSEIAGLDSPPSAIPPVPAVQPIRNLKE